MSAIQNISLFIPHVYANITSSQIFIIFENLRIGVVRNVDLIPKQGSDGKPYNAAYIHFYNWCDNVAARNFQERVLDPNQEARIVYDDPWYWIVLENKGRKSVPGERKPTIDLNAFGFNQPIIIKNHKKVAGFDCGHTPEKEQAKPTNYISPKQFKDIVLGICKPNKVEYDYPNEYANDEEWLRYGENFPIPASEQAYKDRMEMEAYMDELEMERDIDEACKNTHKMSDEEFGKFCIAMRVEDEDEEDNVKFNSNYEPNPRNSAYCDVDGCCSDDE